MKRNSFLTNALEELRQEAGEAMEPGQDVSAVAIAEEPNGQGELRANSGPVTKTNVDSTTDAVAELMEKNVELATENAELQQEVFDNDVEIVDSISDSASQDLEEAVAAGVALEQLAHICDLTVRRGEANVASVASLAFGLEQASLRACLSNPIAALESDVASDATPEQQTEAIGEAAKGKAAEVWRRIAEGVQRVISWITNAIQSIYQRFSPVAKRAEQLLGLTAQIDDNAVIEDAPFIESLRLVEHGGDANKQFKDYADLVDATLYDFFNDSFVAELNKTAQSRESDFMQNLVGLGRVLKAMDAKIFTQRVTPDEVYDGELPPNRRIEAGKTAPVIGGLQLYCVWSAQFDENMLVKAGVVKTPVKLVTPPSIPGANKVLAADLLKRVAAWHKDQGELAARLKKIQGFGKFAEGSVAPKQATVYLRAVTAIATSIIPQLIRMNTQNASNYVRFVEKTLRASSPAAGKQ